MKPIKPQSQMTDQECDFWAKYADFILSRNLSGHAAEWSIRHAQQFAYSLGGIKLRAVDKACLATYFDELGRCDNIVVWQSFQLGGMPGSGSGGFCGHDNMCDHAVDTQERVKG